MYGPLTPCGDCGGAHYDCGAQDPDRCRECGALGVDELDDDGEPTGALYCPDYRCPESPVDGPPPVRGSGEYDFSPPVLPADDVTL